MNIEHYQSMLRSFGGALFPKRVLLGMFTMLVRNTSLVRHIEKRMECTFEFLASQRHFHGPKLHRFKKLLCSIKWSLQITTSGKF